MADYIRVSEYCKLSSINKSKIYRAINSGVIKTKKIDGVKYIDLEQLTEDFKVSTVQLQHHSINLPESIEQDKMQEIIPMQTTAIEDQETIKKQYNILKELYDINEEKTKYLIKSQEETINSLRNEIESKNKHIDRLLQLVNQPPGKTTSSVMADFKILPHEEILSGETSNLKQDTLIKELKQKEQNYLQQISEYEQAAKSYQEKIENLEKPLTSDTDQGTHEEKDKTISDLEYELNSNLVKISKLESDLSEKQEKIDSLTTLLNEKNSNLSSYENGKTILGLNKEDDETIIPDIPVCEDVETLKNVLTVLRNELIAKDKRVRSYEALMNENKPEDMESRDELLNTIEELKISSEQSQNIIEGLQRELNYYKDIINTDDSEKKLKKLEEQLDEKQTIIKQYKNEIENKEKELSTLRQIKSSISEKSIEDLNKDEFVLSHFGQDSDNPSLQESGGMEPITDLVKVLESKDNEIKNLEFELEIIKNTLSRKEKELEKEKQNINNLIEKNSALQNQLESIKETGGLSPSENLDTALKESEERYLEQIKFLENQISELQLRTLTLTAQLEESKMNSPWHKKL